jgi:hypothetical protein
MIARHPHETPENEMWQNNVPPHPSNGGWACIMSARRSMLYESTTHREAENCAEFRDAKIAQHGEPPADFARAWLNDAEWLYQWHVDKHPEDERNAEMLRATKLLRSQLGLGEVA